MSFFSVQDLCASRSKKQLLHHVDLPALAEGQMLGLLGPNAAGKSTLMAALSSQLESSGTIALDQRNQKSWGKKHWQEQVALMPQALPQPTSLTPYELMWSAARAMALPMSDQALAEQIESLLNNLGLNPYANQPLYALSGGKRQLVGLALALVRNPRVLLLDEPTSALDLHWRMVVLNYVKQRLKSNGGVAIAALHDMDLALRYCDSLVLLDQGRVIAAGDPESVLSPANLASVFHVEAEVIRAPTGERLLKVSHPLTQE